jgi:hypothetical protein
MGDDETYRDTLKRYQRDRAQSADAITGQRMAGGLAQPCTKDDDPHDAKRARLVAMIQDAKDNAYAVRLLALGERQYLFTHPATVGNLQRRTRNPEPLVPGFTYKGDPYPPTLWAPLVFGKDSQRGGKAVEGYALWMFHGSFPTEGLILALRQYGEDHQLIVDLKNPTWVDSADGKGRRLATEPYDVARVGAWLESRFGWAPEWDEPESEPVPWEDKPVEQLPPDLTSG